MLYVLTGGPGSGKSSIIRKLQNLGYLCIEEAGREIIQSQIKSSGNALPWENKMSFMMEMFSHAVKTYQEYKRKKGPVFFDRGIVDVIGYARLESLPIPDEIADAARTLRYNTDVFITPPWEEIYTNDTERKQTFDVACATYEKMVEVYQEFGYNVIKVPRLEIDERVQFILDTIDE